MPAELSSTAADSQQASTRQKKHCPQAALIGNLAATVTRPDSGGSDEPSGRSRAPP